MVVFMKARVSLVPLVLALLLLAPIALAQKTADLSQSQMPSVVTVPPEALPSSHFEVEAATNAYLAQIPASARARSDAYFEGGYWLMLWDFLVAVVSYWILLRFGISAKMRDFAVRVSRFALVQDVIYWVQFVIVTTDPFERLNEVARQFLQQSLQSGMFIFLDTDLKIDNPQSTVAIDRDKTAQLGLKMSDYEAAPWGLGKPHDVANLVVFLASDESRFINGTEIVIDNALTIQ